MKNDPILKAIRAICQDMDNLTYLARLTPNSEYLRHINLQTNSGFMKALTQIVANRLMQEGFTLSVLLTRDQLICKTLRSNLILSALIDHIHITTIPPMESSNETQDLTSFLNRFNH